MLSRRVQSRKGGGGKAYEWLISLPPSSLMVKTHNFGVTAKKLGDEKGREGEREGGSICFGRGGVSLCVCMGGWREG